MDVYNYRAPTKRTELAQIREQMRAAMNNHVVQSMLDAVPDFAMILNEDRQIVAVNDIVLKALGLESVEPLLGKRPGESVNCIHSAEARGGCGCAEACRSCGAAMAIFGAFEGQTTLNTECQISVNAAGQLAAFDFLAKASFAAIEGTDFVLLVLKDIGAEKRKGVMERVFYHDVLNIAGGISGLAEVMELEAPSSMADISTEIRKLSFLVVDEIKSHRNLMMAEDGHLVLDVTQVRVADVLEEAAIACRHHNATQGRPIVVDADGQSTLATDEAILGRVVLNLTKNAAEACDPGQTVTLSCRTTPEGVRIAVHNPGYIPTAIRTKIFKRSFSTKASIGRGIGTYSVKLFGEKYLGGSVRFTSTPEDGTTFIVELPKEISGHQTNAA